MAPGCAQELTGVDPPDRSFYYPMGLAVAADGATAYVLSSNFDQRFNAGWVSVVDVDALVEATEESCGLCGPREVCVDAGDAPSACMREVEPPDCAQACERGEVCVREGEGTACRTPWVIDTSAIVQALRVPSLGALITLDPAGTMAVVSARGREPLVQIEMEDGRDLHCGDPEATVGLTTSLQRTDCDREHLTRLVVSLEVAGVDDPAGGEAPEVDPERSVNLAPVAGDRTFDLDKTDREAVLSEEVADPYGVHLFRPDGPGGPLYLAVGYLGGGYLSILEVPPDGPMQHVRLLGRFATGIGAIRTYPGPAGVTRLLATSQLIDGTSDLATLYDIDVGTALVGEGGAVRVVPIGASYGGSEILDFVFQPGAAAPLGFTATRNPDSVSVLDARLEPILIPDPSGAYQQIRRPRYVPLSSAPVPGRPSGLEYIERGALDLVAATAFDTDSLFLLSVVGSELRLDRRIDRICQGPFQAAHATRGGRDLLLVTCFFDHGLTVVDITGPDPLAWSVLGQLRRADMEPSQSRAR